MFFLKIKQIIPQRISGEESTSPEIPPPAARRTTVTISERESRTVPTIFRGGKLLSFFIIISGVFCSEGAETSSFLTSSSIAIPKISESFIILSRSGVAAPFSHFETLWRETSRIPKGRPGINSALCGVYKFFRRESFLKIASFNNKIITFLNVNVYQQGFKTLATGGCTFVFQQIPTQGLKYS